MTPEHDDLKRAMDAVPAGRWGVAVSGGADSVALLRLAMLQPNLQLQVIHLDHETRDGGSAADAKFVQRLASTFNLPLSLAQRSEIDVSGSQNNAPARYRAARLGWFGIVVKNFELDGVLYAHHLDDQAETIAQRLLRGRQPEGLGGMSKDTQVNGVRLLRPLLDIRRETLRDFLTHLGQPWVEDVSNASAVYQRNRVRSVLKINEHLRDALVGLGAAAQIHSEWLERSSTTLRPSFHCDQIAQMPPPLARHAAGRWLREQGVPAPELSPNVCDRLISLALDRAGPRRMEFPGKVAVLRKRGTLEVCPPTSRDR